MPEPKILIADDDENIIFAFKRTLENSNYSVISSPDGEDALKTLLNEHPDLAFIDIAMPKKDGLTVLKEAKKAGIKTPIVVITGYGTMQTAIEAMKLGAYEYITKPLDVEKVRVVAKHAIEMVKLQQEVSDLKAALDRPEQKDEIIGNHPLMQEVFKQIGAVALTPNTTNVIITGESGTGKELVAKAIHNAGENSQAPFIAINCTVLPETLLESELFGYEQGAFTGATSRKLGKFEVAGSGTIFLDEIGDMPLHIQQKLLRVLEERTFERIGGNQKVNVEARFITATNKDLALMLKAGTFRKDLYYRLQVIPIELPPLHDRGADIPLLANFFLSKYNRMLHKQIKVISEEVMNFLMNYGYPGNVRELQNILEHCITRERGDVLTPASFPEYLKKKQTESRYHFTFPFEGSFEADHSDKSFDLKEIRADIIDSFEKQFVEHLLTVTKGNVTSAAQKANIERQSFQRLMRKHGIRSENFRGS